MKALLTAGIWLGLAAVCAASPLQTEKIRFAEAELRVLLAERNIEIAAKRMADRLHAERRLANDKLNGAYEHLRSSLAASERRSRQTAAARLERYAALYTGAAEASDALIRLAVLRMEDADDRFAAEIRASMDATEAVGAEPVKDYAAALIPLRRLLAVYEHAPHRDVAMYLLGYALAEMGQENQAMGIFQAILHEVANTPLRSEILVRIGDYYFEQNDAALAGEFYQKAMKNKGPWFDRALYKWAWSLYKRDKYSQAIEAFTQVADLGAARPDLREEALQYLAVSYLEGGGLALAESHMRSRGPRNYDFELWKRIADTFYEATEYAQAVTAYSRLLDLEPANPQAPTIAQRVLLCLHQQAELDAAVAARWEFVQRFSPGTAWYAAQISRPAVRRAADVWSERRLYEYATYHHYRELRDRPESRVFAEQGYRSYLARFAGRPRAVQMGFYLAEIAYDQGAYPLALSLYTRVAYSAPDPETDIAQRAAYNMVLAAREMHGGDAAGLDQLVDVSRRFAELRPHDERTPLVLYHSGRLLCDAGRQSDCRLRLSELIDLYPGSELAMDAVWTMVDSYVSDKRYGELAAWADRMSRRREFTDVNGIQALRDLVGSALFQDARSMEGGADPAQAAARYLEVYARYGATRAGAAALYNAAYGFERAGKFPRALELYSIMLTKHPQAANAPRAAFRTAYLQERALQYPAAVSAYAVVFDRYPTSPEARDALYNAAALEAVSGNYRAAAGLFERHYSIYGFSVTEQTLMRAGVNWEAAREPGMARAYFLASAQADADRGRKAYAFYRAALTEARDRRKLLEKAQQACAPCEPGLAAAIQFALSEELRESYLRVSHAGKKGLAAALNRKAGLLKKLQTAYLAVKGDPDLAIAALYRTGEAYAAMAAFLEAAPMPANLSEEEAEAYQIMLAEQVAPVAEKAEQAFAAAVAAAERAGHETLWSVRARVALARPFPVRLITGQLEPLFVTSAQQTGRPALRSAVVQAAAPAPMTSGTSPLARRFDRLMGRSLARPSILFAPDAKEAP